MNITLCGAGNAAQTLIALLGEAHRVTVFAPLADEADRLDAAASAQGVAAIFQDGSTRSGCPSLITRDPHEAAQGAELILLATPAFAHEQVLAALGSHLQEQVWIAALPARGGFDWMVQRAVPLSTQTTLIGLQTLPWACRIRTWGKQVEVLGVKTAVGAAVYPQERGAEILEQMEALLNAPLKRCAGFLALTLANTGQLIHPGIMYGLFHRWNGAPFPCEQAPLFYGGVDAHTAEVLQALSDEVQQLCRALTELDLALDLQCVEPLEQWVRQAYAGQIDDPTSLYSAFRTNRAYAGLQAPVQRVSNGLCIPDFAHRYLSEDAPFGLLVSKGIAELIGVATPAMDRVIEWAQARLGRVYLVEGRVIGPDVVRSRAPQRFGVTLDDLLPAAFPKGAQRTLAPQSRKEPSHEALSGA